MPTRKHWFLTLRGAATADYPYIFGKFTICNYNIFIRISCIAVFISTEILSFFLLAKKQNKFILCKNFSLPVFLKSSTDLFLHCFSFFVLCHIFCCFFRPSVLHFEHLFITAFGTSSLVRAVSFFPLLYFALNEYFKFCSCGSI